MLSVTPDEEIIEDYEREDIFEAVVERYSGYADGAEPANEAEDGIFEEPLVLTKDAVTALAIDAVKQWCIQQADSAELSRQLQSLDLVGRIMVQKKTEHMKQSSIQSYFKPRE